MIVLTMLVMFLLSELVHMLGADYGTAAWWAGMAVGALIYVFVCYKIHSIEAR